MTPATANSAADTNAPCRNPPKSTAPPRITPANATAISPAILAIALLIAEPIPLCAGSTAAKIAAVSGDTVTLTGKVRNAMNKKDAEVAENRIENVKALLADLNEAGKPPMPALEKIEAFLDDLTLDSERAEEKERTGDAVTLITMHSCKGLEYPHVYVVGLEDGLLPHTRSKVEGTIDEERRLFYVAITRAMKTLTISHCETRKKFGAAVPCHPSPFLKELPEELVEHGDVKAKQPVAVDSGRNMFASLRAAIG